MNLILAFILMIGGLIAETVPAQSTEKEKLYGVWYRSYEEDKGDIAVYRPKTYRFPPMRAREKMEITKEGEIMQYRIGPSDAYEKVKGKFTYCELHKELVATFTEKGVEKTHTYKVLSLEKTILKLKTVKE